MLTPSYYGAAYCCNACRQRAYRRRRWEKRPLGQPESGQLLVLLIRMSAQWTFNATDAELEASNSQRVLLENNRGQMASESWAHLPQTVRSAIRGGYVEPFPKWPGRWRLTGRGWRALSGQSTSPTTAASESPATVPTPAERMRRYARKRGPS